MNNKLVELRTRKADLSVSVELLVEAAEDDRLGVDVLLGQRRPERVRLRVLARVVQVVAAPTTEIKTQRGSSDPR